MSADTHVLVPREPTEEMIAAGWIDKEDVSPREIYWAMIAAAPTAEAEGLVAERDSLRKALILAGRHTGAFLADEVSSEFLAKVPEEVRLRLTALTERLAAAEAEIATNVYVPGVWRCPKCDFRLIQSNLNARNGTVTARDQPGETCPNCHGPLWRCTWQDEAKDAYKTAESQMDRALAAEAEITALRAQVERKDKALEPWGKWFAYEDAPNGSYACLVSQQEREGWSSPTMQWMPAQGRQPLAKRCVVMPFLMPNADAALSPKEPLDGR